jgi:hypothetical protein
MFWKAKKKDKDWASIRNFFQSLFMALTIIKALNLTKLKKKANRIVEIL